MLALLSLLVVALGPETCLMTQSKCDLQSPGDPPTKPHSFWHFGRDVLFNHLFKSYEADKDKLNNSCRLSLCPLSCKFKSCKFKLLPSEMRADEWRRRA